MKCPYCNEKAIWIENKEIYGRNYGKSYMCWLCRKCSAYVGCYNNTKKPLGTMANKNLRALRIQAHDVIDNYWKKEIQTRGVVYRLLKEHYKKEIHIGSSNENLCRDIIENADKILSWKE